MNRSAQDSPFTSALIPRRPSQSLASLIVLPICIAFMIHRAVPRVLSHWPSQQCGGFVAPFIRCRKGPEATAQAIELADARAGTGGQVSLLQSLPTIQSCLSVHTAASLYSEVFSWGPWAPDQGRTGAAPGRNSTESLVGSEDWGLPPAPGSPPSQSPQAVVSFRGMQAGVRSQAGAESRLPVSLLWCSRELWSSWCFLSH